jgi:hypothetical protein
LKGVTRLKTIKVSTINDTIGDYIELFDIGQDALSSKEDIILNFEECYFLKQNAVAFLGGLARMINHQGRNLIFNWDSMRKEIRANLRYNRFISVFGQESLDDDYPNRNAIPYREDSKMNAPEIVKYLQEDWLGRGWVQVSKKLKDEIVGKMFEIYSNAFEHSNSQIGIMSCGQHYPKLHELKLTVVDFGIGIPSSVRAHLRMSGMDTKDALKWAFTKGNSTKSESTVARGLGLDLLKEFVSINEGSLEVYSNNGYVAINKNEETYDEIPVEFNGTLITITIKCDEKKYYCLRTEDINHFRWEDSI